MQPALAGHAAREPETLDVLRLTGVPEPQRELRIIAGVVEAFCQFSGIMNAIITKYFPVMVVTDGKSGPFFIFAAMMVIDFLIVLTVYPETRGASLESLQHQLEG